MTKDEHPKRRGFIFGRKTGKPPEEISSAENPTIELPKGGIYAQKVYMDNRIHPFIMLGLTTLEEFEESKWQQAFANNLTSDSGSLATLMQRQKYLVLRQEAEGENIDAVFVFPTTIIHRDFYDKLQSLGYKGQLQSAGLVSEALFFQDESDTLTERGLLIQQSNAYQKELNRKFKKD